MHVLGFRVLKKCLTKYYCTFLLSWWTGAWCLVFKSNRILEWVDVWKNESMIGWCWNRWNDCQTKEQGQMRSFEKTWIGVWVNYKGCSWKCQHIKKWLFASIHFRFEWPKVNLECRLWPCAFKSSILSEECYGEISALLHPPVCRSPKRVHCWDVWIVKPAHKKERIAIIASKYNNSFWVKMGLHSYL